MTKPSGHRVDTPQSRERKHGPGPKENPNSGHYEIAMNRCRIFLLVVVYLSLVQFTVAQTSTATALPRLARFGGTARDLNRSPLATMVGIAFALYAEQKGGDQNAGVSSPTRKPQVLSLDFTNNGQRLAATVGQQIEITLMAVGPYHLGHPQISFPAIRLESVVPLLPPNPAGVKLTYTFDAVAEGEVQVKIPLISQSPGFAQKTFAVTIHVGSGAGKPPPLYRSMTPDQENTAPWNNAWTILQDNRLRRLRQDFTPSLPKLTGVEVELARAKPGPAHDEISMALLDAKGQMLSTVSKTVTGDDCDHVLFFFPRGGWPVLPGQVYNHRAERWSRSLRMEVCGGRLCERECIL
jgi:hypothetical protein